MQGLETVAVALTVFPNTQSTLVVAFTSACDAPFDSRGHSGSPPPLLVGRVRQNFGFGVRNTVFFDPELQYIFVQKNGICRRRRRPPSQRLLLVHSLQTKAVVTFSSE